jgi:TM2 domain-containing membrane protein YozV
MSEWNPAAGPGPFGADDIFIGDDDRNEAVNLLGEHFRWGRLEPDEYSQRMQGAWAARTRRELAAVFGALPAPWPTCLRPPAPMPTSPYPQPPNVIISVPPMPYLGPSDKSKVVAGLLQILLPFGVGRFYTGHGGLGAAQLLVTLLTCGFGAIWSVIDGIVLLAAGGTDSLGRPLP